jgi:Glycine rich protein/Collagen triple helix repeat (20 copies)
VSRAARAGAVGGASLLAALLLAMPAGALAATPPIVTKTFSSTDTQQELTVPVGVSSVRVEAIGEPGETGFGPDGGVGGAGADVVGELPVTAGEVLYVEVAAPGFDGGEFGGFIGGEGGSASDVRTVSTADSESLGSRLLVAAGGGGGGGSFDGAGGAGGAAGNPGTRGASEGFDLGGAPGNAGTLTGGGTGGASCGSMNPWSGGPGSLGLGGRGGEGFPVESSGGGGGGGYTGGGGGEGACDPSPSEGGGGGGGGASFVFGDATFSSFGAASTTTVPSVSISYPSPATATPDSATIAFPATQPLQTVSAPQTVTITNEGGNPLQITGATFADSTSPAATDHPEDFLIGSSSCFGAVVFEASCQLTVRFAPQGEGPQTATLQIASDAGAGTTMIALSGTGGSLPQGPTGATGPAGPAGATGSAGANGSQGSTGSPGAAGPQGETGAKGDTGPTGATGANGAQGSQGPAGPKGERGPAGPVAVYECHPRKLNGKFKNACYVRVASSTGTQSVMRAKLERGNAVYATGPVSGAKPGEGIAMLATRAVPAGRYRLVLVSRGGAWGSRYVTVK